MSEVLRVFLSATSADLGAVREAAKHALLTLGYFPVEQAHFGPAPETLLELLRRKIEQSDAVLHIAGECSGAEPLLDAGEAASADELSIRRSFTQWEYHFARELKKPLYVFVCGEDFPYQPHEPESDVRQQMQRAHRARVRADGHKYETLADFTALENRLREIQFHVSRLESAQRRSGRRLATIGGVIAVALLVLIGFVALLHKNSARQAVKTEQQTDELAKLRALVQRVADGTATAAQPGEQVTPDERFNRALQAAADHEHLTLEQTQSALREFAAKVRAGPAAGFLDRALADFAEKNYAGAETNALQVANKARETRLRAAETAREAAASEQKAWLLAGNSQLAQLKYAEAEKSYRVVVELSQASRGQEFVDAQAKLTGVLFAMGRIDEALAAMDAGLEAVRADPATEPDDLAVAVSGRALLAAVFGRDPNAESVVRESITAVEQRRGADNPYVLGMRSSLAGYLLALGRYTEAEKEFLKVIAVAEKGDPKDAPYIVQCSRFLGMTLIKNGRPAEAEIVLNRAIDSAEKLGGAKHPDVAACLIVLAEANREQGKFEPANALLEKALKIYEEVFGPEEAAVADTLQAFGALRHAEGRMPEAIVFYERALALREKRSGPDSLKTLESLHVLATSLHEAGRYDEAAAAIERTFPMREKLVGPVSGPVAAGFDMLGRVRHDQGRHAEAEALFGKALAIYDKLGQSESAAYLGTLASVPDVLLKQDKIEELEKCLRQLASLQTKLLGADASATLDTENMLGASIRNQGRLEEAEPLILRVLEIRRKRAEAEPLSYARSLQTFGRLRGRQDRKAEARALFEEALAIYSKAQSPDNVTSAEQDLAALR